MHFCPSTPPVDHRSVFWHLPFLFTIFPSTAFHFFSSNLSSIVLASVVLLFTSFPLLFSLLFCLPETLCSPFAVIVQLRFSHPSSTPSTLIFLHSFLFEAQNSWPKRTANFPMVTSSSSRSRSTQSMTSLTPRFRNVGLRILGFLSASSQGCKPFVIKFDG
ncbi:uncharacterized protein LOC103948077 isoform X2 [Pyrus x bretschneideri]|uniref:uncharacterized protein LOC103948077 isoform X2 n=1 Tax=Pyrus x bretschneideri TaxID=225117 RepID=UPI0020305201|nr:uncharacterized protein LOC103948077 isoform X2 [Pyrus x bretschneideri]